MSMKELYFLMEKTSKTLISTSFAGALVSYSKNLLFLTTTLSTTSHMAAWMKTTLKKN